MRFPRVDFFFHAWKFFFHAWNFFSTCGNFFPHMEFFSMGSQNKLCTMIGHFQGGQNFPPKVSEYANFIWVLADFFPEDIRLCQYPQKQRFANSDTFGGSCEHPRSVQSRDKVDSENPWEKNSMCGKNIQHVKKISTCGKKIPHVEIPNA